MNPGTDKINAFVFCFGLDFCFFVSWDKIGIEKHPRQVDKKGTEVCSVVVPHEDRSLMVYHQANLRSSGPQCPVSPQGLVVWIPDIQRPAGADCTGLEGSIGSGQ